MGGPSRATVRGSVEESRVACSVQKLIVSSSPALVDDLWVRGRKRWPSGCRGARPCPIEGGGGVGSQVNDSSPATRLKSRADEHAQYFKQCSAYTATAQHIEEAACHPHRIAQGRRAGQHEYKMKPPRRRSMVQRSCAEFRGTLSI